MSGGHRRLKFSTTGRGRSRDLVIWISFFKFVSLPYPILFLDDVFNNGFRKIFLKITNDLEPGFNLLSKTTFDKADYFRTVRLRMVFRVIL